MVICKIMNKKERHKEQKRKGCSSLLFTANYFYY